MSTIRRIFRLLSPIKRAIVEPLKYYLGPVRITPQLLDVPVSSSIAGQYIVATKRGLYLIKDKQLYLLRNGDFYGITFHGDTIIVFERIGTRGRLISFSKDMAGRGFTKCKVLLRGLPYGCHQIDWIRDRLYITDTHNNRIIRFEPKTNILRSFYPLGKLSNGRKSPNYAHINSILLHKGEYYIYCHNETTKTGRKSQIIVSTTLLRPERIIDLDDENGHNNVVIKDVIYHCDSMNGILRANNVTIFECESFTRGLSITDDFIIVGGSEYANRDDRVNSAGFIFILNREHELIESFWFPGMVQEIRCLDKPDYSLSIYSDLED